MNVVGEVVSKILTLPVQLTTYVLDSVTSRQFPLVVTKTQFEIISRRRPHVKCVDCDGMPDVLVSTKDTAARYAKSFSAKALRYDSIREELGDRNAVYLVCENTCNKAVAVAIVWCIWRGVCRSESTAEFVYVARLGRKVSALVIFAPAIDVAVSLLRSQLSA